MAAGSDWTKAITMAFEEQLLHWRLNPLQLTTGSSKTHLHCIDDNRNAANGYRRVLLPHSAAQRSAAQHSTSQSTWIFPVPGCVALHQP